jgi:hypothetical protein
VSRAFQRLFKTYPSFQADDDDDAVRVYFEAVADYETQDIETAVGNFLAGRAPGHNPSFVPPAPLVGAETRRVMNLRLDRANRERSLHPRLPPPDVAKSPDSIERVRNLVRNATRHMGGTEPRYTAGNDDGEAA